MGQLLDGVWHTQNATFTSANGKFVRKQSKFRNWITPDGAPGVTGTGGYKAQAGRYHLYVSNACPWAHRTLIFRKLKGLEDHISLSVTHWFMGEDGWTFDAGEGVIADPINNARFLHQIYTKADSGFSGRVTVPVLWDKHTGTIVSNESSEIIRMFNSAFDDAGALAGDYYPLSARAQIDSINQRIYDTVNNGVYKTGFATTQSAYEEAFTRLFETLDWLEARLEHSRFLIGDNITEADWRLFTTLVRFDPVYVGHFKCNRNRIADYRHLSGYLRDLYQHPSIAETFNLKHIKQHYYGCHESINPTRIVAMGPQIDYDAPHNRAEI